MGTGDLSKAHAFAVLNDVYVEQLPPKQKRESFNSVTYRQSLTLIRFN